jgi:tRNA U34 5-carboxymethylaminomethyl modifying GTPase MnmE/TrmE
MSGAAETLRLTNQIKTSSSQSVKTDVDFALIAGRVRCMGTAFADVALRLDAISGFGKGEFCIASAGLMNPGKSTLLNALLGKDEAFKTADVRETTEVKSEVWKDNSMLVDTPGFSSAFADDDCEAMSALRKADLILFVHNIAIGGLNKAELDVLMSLEEFLGENDFARRVLFVNTRRDECPDENLDVNCKECADLVNENIGCELDSFVVSPKLYLDGMRIVANGNKVDGELLMKESGIGKLSKAIFARKKSHGKKTCNAVIDQVIAELKTRLESLTQIRNEKSRNLRQEEASLSAAWESTLAEIRPFWDECFK